jgi:hypothetical protein
MGAGSEYGATQSERNRNLIGNKTHKRTNVPLSLLMQKKGCGLVAKAPTQNICITGPQRTLGNWHVDICYLYHRTFFWSDQQRRHHHRYGLGLRDQQHTTNKVRHHSSLIWQWAHEVCQFHCPEGQVQLGHGSKKKAPSDKPICTIMQPTCPTTAQPATTQ